VRTALTLLVVTAGVIARADEPTSQPATPPAPTAEDAPPFTPEQLAWLAKNLPKPPPYTLHFDVFMKGLYKNDQSNGALWLGNPNPEGDNYSGSNGIAANLGIRIDGHVTPNLSAGARLETRFGMLFSDFYENGDLAVDPNGRPAGVNATGESLGMNHAAYAQLRGIYIQYDHPGIPTVTSLRAGSSDLSMWNAWTVGKIRFIDRDNAKGFFATGAIPSLNLDYNLARVALPKLFASAGFNTGIADPLIENPFWGDDADYVGKVHWGTKTFDLTAVAHYLLDLEADLNDPDALGSTNVIDQKDGVVTTIPRYENMNATLEGEYHPSPALDADVLVAGSRSDPNLRYVLNSIDGDQGLSPIPMKTVNSAAVRARAEWKPTPAIDLRAEYFNIGADWVSTFGTRREDDVLWTEGFLDGQLPTLNIANEFIDFTEPFYETIIGWNGLTLKPKLTLGKLALELEGTAIDYNTNAQGRCTSKSVPGCAKSGGVYPDFLFPDGMTDTDFFTFANTNDRGRDPRAAYRTNQDRFTWLGFVKATLAFGAKDRGSADVSLKYIRDKDLRDTTIIGADDYLGNLWTGVAHASWRFGARWTAGAGVKIDYWDEAHRSGAVVAGVPHYPDYKTSKEKMWLEARYELKEGAFLSYRIELLEKNVTTTDPTLDFSYRNVVRSLLMLYAGF
jgi:hypothetical protein